MLKRTLLTVVIAVLMASSALTVMAQDDDSTGETDPFSLTATQLVEQATQTAVAGQSEAQAMSTQSVNQQDTFAMTATQLIVDATATAQFNIDNGIYPAEAVTPASPMGQTMVIFGLLIFILVGLGGGYVLFASRNQDGKRKLG